MRTADEIKARVEQTRAAEKDSLYGAIKVQILTELQWFVDGPGRADDTVSGGSGSVLPRVEDSSHNPPPQPMRPAPSDFAKLPWRTNKRGQWAFADDAAFKELAAKIGTGPSNSFTDEKGFVHTITVGDNGKRFINRSRSK